MEYSFKNYTFFSVLLFVLQSCAMLADQKHTDAIKSLELPITEAKLKELKTKILNLPDEKLTYVVNMESWECEINQYPKTNLIKIIDSTIAGLSTCSKASQLSLKKCLDASEPHHRNYCEIKYDSSCTINIPENILYIPWDKNCYKPDEKYRAGSYPPKAASTLNDPLGANPTNLVLQVVHQQLEDFKENYKNKLNKAEDQRANQRLNAAIAKDKAYRDSPDATSTTLCNLFETGDRAKLEFEREKKVGEIGGFVNKIKMHELSSFIVDFPKKVSHYKAIYKQRSGKDWDRGLCN